VTTYCRPFAKSDRDVIVGKAWTAGFSADELALHHRVLILRNNDAAHTAGYVGRVNLFIQSVPSDETQPITYSVGTSARIFGESDLQPTPSPTGATSFPVIWARDASALLDGDSIVKGCIDEGALALIYGASNSGKTFLALDLALSVAAGQTWNGHGVRGGLVAYVAAEAGYRIQRRVRGWLDTRCGEQAEPPLVIVPRVVNLMHDVETVAFADFLTALASRAWWEQTIPAVRGRVT